MQCLAMTKLLATTMFESRTWDKRLFWSDDLPMCRVQLCILRLSVYVPISNRE